MESCSSLSGELGCTEAFRVDASLVYPFPPIDHTNQGGYNFGGGREEDTF